MMIIRGKRKKFGENPAPVLLFVTLELNPRLRIRKYP
jgi:hypothetical protein